MDLVCHTVVQGYPIFAPLGNCGRLSVSHDLPIDEMGLMGNLSSFRLWSNSLFALRRVGHARPSGHCAKFGADSTAGPEATVVPGH